MQNKLKIFSDFDGTITLHDVWMDVGDRFIRDKNAWNSVIRDFEEQKIGARQCFLAELKLMEDFNFDEFNNIIDKQQIDLSFIHFYKFCLSERIDLTILSEGMDYYINRILNNQNLKIPFFSNRFILSEDKKHVSLGYPFSDSECEKCGCCKRNLLMNMTADNEISVFIGDGFSDACVVNYADIVFAKKSLASYCWKNNVTYFDYTTFSDIQKKLEKILQQKNIKHRQTAKLNRREVFMRG